MIANPQDGESARAQALHALWFYTSPLNPLYHCRSTVERTCLGCGTQMVPPCEWWGLPWRAYCRPCYLAMSPAERLAPFTRRPVGGRRMSPAEVEVWFEDLAQKAVGAGLVQPGARLVKD